jgi:hypothetical protein
MKKEEKIEKIVNVYRFYINDIAVDIEAETFDEALNKLDKNNS